MAPLKFGVTIPLKSARAAADIAKEAEAAGWDGFFIGEAIWCIDAWMTLALAAVQTTRIRLGTMVTPMPLMQPWKLAGESVTLDLLSNGRAVLGLGMGAVWMGWQAFPDYNGDTHVRAEMLDEGIDILTELYKREQFDYNGKHYRIKLTAMDVMHYPPKPIQQPRIPLWVVGVWPRKKSMRRVLKCDGIIPARMTPDGQFADLRPEDVAEIKAYTDANRTLTTPFDIIVEGHTVGLSTDETRAKLLPWVAAGATWWNETLFGVSDEQMLEQIRRGPPKLEDSSAD